MATERTTANNPGAFQRARTPGLRETGKAVLRDLRGRRFASALVRSLTGVANAASPLVAPLLGPRFVCPCCGGEAAFFVHRGNQQRIAWNSACPHCDARSRHRGLTAFLPGLLEERRPQRVLHFAPEPILRRIFVGRPGVTYETCDLFLRDVTYPDVDVQKMRFADASFDLLLCNHVLEHVEDDVAAMREMARILRPGGAAVITVPGDFTREQTIRFTGELPNGHHRDYGMDVVQKLGTAFGRVEAVDLHAFDDAGDGRRRGIRKHEIAFVCGR